MLVVVLGCVVKLNVGLYYLEIMFMMFVGE